MSRAPCCAILTAVVLVWPSASAASEQDGTVAVAADVPIAGGRLLDVPYVPQSVDLCGGAALAMVLRYWGDRLTVAEDFAGLVDPVEGGIRTGRLVEAARERGWTALPMPRGSADLARSQVDRGRPPVALIEERGGVLHYVVIVAWTDTQVIVHDPARAPFRAFTHEEFDQRWAVTDRWLLVVLPGPEPPRTQAKQIASDPGAIDTGLPQPCRDLLVRGLALAASRELPAAEQTLSAATEDCPDSAATWRELAGVNFLQERWADAEYHAARTVALAPDDDHGWRILSAARYQQSDWIGALRAMRVTGDPAIDLVEVDGAVRTPHPVIVETTGLVPRAELSADAFARAARRLDDLPAAMRSRLSYRPTVIGAMTVEAALVEREMWPRPWTSWAAIAARAAAVGTMRVDLAGLMRSGELITGLWRWRPERRLVGFRLATPAPGRLPGIAVVEGTWERQTYGAAEDRGSLTVESRRRVGLLLTDWASGSVRWEAEAALERFGARQHASVGGALELYALGNRVAIRTELAGWAGRDAARFSTGAVEIAGRLGVQGRGPWLSARSGLRLASAGSPMALWSGAGIGRARPARLRAHPLLSDDVLTGRVFGRLLWHGSIEYAHPLFRHPAATIAMTGFSDTARAWQGRPGIGAASITHVDIGAGLRIGAPGMRGSVDVNVAYGTRDSRIVVSAGVRAPWPGFDGWRER